MAKIEILEKKVQELEKKIDLLKFDARNVQITIEKLEDRISNVERQTHEH